MGGEETVVTILTGRHHHGLDHGRMLGERGFDLTQLDAMAPDLDLVILATQELDVAVGEITPEIAGSI